MGLEGACRARPVPDLPGYPAVFMVFLSEEDTAMVDDVVSDYLSQDTKMGMVLSETQVMELLKAFLLEEGRVSAALGVVSAVALRQVLV